MKNYDVKSSVLDLNTKIKITVQGKRLAYLVPNMFNKIISGYGKKIVIFMNSKVENIAESVPNINTEIVNDIVKEEVGLNIAPAEDNIVKTETKIENVESSIELAKTTPEVDEKVKNYIVKVLSVDTNYLRNAQLRTVGAPRKLLISTVFVQKLLTHRFNITKENLEIKQEEIVVPNKTPEVNATVNTKEAGVARYVKLMNKRKEAVAARQACEKEMTELVNEFGITLDMVNAELAKGNINKIG